MFLIEVVRKYLILKNNFYHSNLNLSDKNGYPFPYLFDGFFSGLVAIYLLLKGFSITDYDLVKWVEILIFSIVAGISTYNILLKLKFKRECLDHISNKKLYFNFLFVLDISFNCCVLLGIVVVLSLSFFGILLYAFVFWKTFSAPGSRSDSKDS